RFHDEIETMVVNQGANLDAFSLDLQEGQVHLAATASDSTGSVSFSMNAVPHLARPDTRDEWDEEYGEHVVVETPGRKELWFEMRDIQVDVEKAGWVQAVEALAFFIGIPVAITAVETLAAIMGMNTFSKIDASSNTSAANLTQSFTLGK